ncbi:MAG: 3-hydroxy-5-phosphonooxypentane-2,4-dione thiolase [ANME-2 cluster archaeon]|jgi:putative autoinducer-2 (AI-2) aldolase|nr:3-hydroxy-5-phosphonooxypentane-2,4-dione thiolase [ANME-2 cluster archaeon]
MDWGMQNRISQIIKPKTGRTVMLAVDHGYFLGPTSRLENAEATIKPLIEYADALMPARGVLRTSVDPGTSTPIVLRVSGGNSIVCEDLSREGITTSVEDALRLNVAAVAMSIYVGSQYEHQTLMNLGNLVNECERYGMPVVAVTAVGKDMVRDARYLGLCCRIAAELGAKIVKTYYTDDFNKVVEGCPVPIVVAGGKQMDTEMDVFKLVHDAISEGAVGVDMGRNIWQNDHPVAMIKAVRSVVHQNFTPKEAMDLYNSEKGK